MDNINNNNFFNTSWVDARREEVRCFKSNSYRRMHGYPLMRGIINKRRKTILKLLDNNTKFSSYMDKEVYFTRTLGKTTTIRNHKKGGR